MYDVKASNQKDEYINPENYKDRTRDISERGYYHDKLTQSVLNTKSSYVPADTLL